jgi:hypothetical protein
LNAMPERFKHRIGERFLVPGVLIASAVNVERRRYQSPATTHVGHVLSHSHVRVIGLGHRWKIECAGNPINVTRRQRGPAFHQRFVNFPELAPRRGMFG